MNTDPADGKPACHPPRCDPRVARSRAAVLAATAEIIAAEGLAGVSIEAVATRSGVAKTTIYRHWDSRAALVVDAFRAMSAPCAVPDTGRLRDDLVSLMTALAAQLAGAPWACALAGLLDAVSRDPELQTLHGRFMTEVRGPFNAVLDRAVARGELPPDVDRARVGMLLAGPLFYARMVLMTPVTDPAAVAAMVDAVLPGLCPAGPDPRPTPTATISAASTPGS